MKIDCIHLLVVLAISTLLLTASRSVYSQDQPTKKPNILWLTIEDTSFLFGCYGDPVAKTPNIDRLAEEGTLFTNAFASSPVCSAARSALITGMYVGELGVGNHRSVVDIPDDIQGYPAYLRDAGYYTTNHTKNDFNFTNAREFANECWNDNSNQSHWRNRPEGQPFFSIFNYVDSHQSRTSVNSYKRFQRNIQSRLSPGEITSPDTVDLPPFYRDSPQMRKAYARVYDCITLVDKQIGERLQQLEDDGLADDTIVFFFADHGQGIPRYKTFPFGLGYRVPLIVRVPEKYRDLVPLMPGTTCDDIVSFVDLGPTVLNIAGVPIPENMSGKPVMGPNMVKKDCFFGSLNDIGATENHSRSVSDGRYMYVRNYMPHLGYSQTQMYCDSADIMRFIREDNHAGRLSGPAAEFMEETRPAEALYDMENDRWEINNLVDDPSYRDVLENMRSVNHDKIMEIRDLHYLHRWEIETRGDGKPAAEIRDNEQIYPLKKILAVAELSGMGPDVIDQQIQALTDPEPMCRYWALIGLQAQTPIGNTTVSAAEKLLEDPAPYVRYEAAFICCKYGQGEQTAAQRVLVDGINESHTILVNHAMRKISLLEKQAAPFVDEVDRVAKTYKNLKDNKKNYEIQTSINYIHMYLEDRVPQPIDSY